MDVLGQLALTWSTLFVVVDPIGVVPIFLTLTRGESRDEARRTALRACATACGLIMFFALFGTLVFQVFSVSLAAFRVAGGLLLMMTALDMLRARPSETRSTPTETQESSHKGDVALVPLAIPLLAGPGTIATVMVLMQRSASPRAAVPVLLAVVLVFVATYFILRGATFIQRVLGQTGVAVLERVMGLLLAALAVQFIADGTRDLFRAG